MSTSSSGTTADLWWAWLALCLAFCAVAWAVPAVADLRGHAGVVVLGVAVACAYWLPWARAIPEPRAGGIRWMAHGLALALLGNLGWRGMQLAGRDPSGSPLDVVHVGSAVLLMAGTVRLVRRRPADAAALYDAIVVAAAAAALVWSLIVLPSLTTTAEPTRLTVTGAVFAVGFVVLTTALLRMVLNGRSVSTSLVMMLSGLTLLVVSGSAFYLQGQSNSQGTPNLVQTAYILAVAIIGAAFLHPSLGERDDAGFIPPKLRMTRLVLLTASAAVPLLLVIFRPVSRANVVGLTVLAVALMMIVLLRSSSLLTAMEELARARDDTRFRALIRHSADAIVVIEPCGIMKTASDALRRTWTPISPADDGGDHRIDDWVCPDDRDSLAAFCAELTNLSDKDGRHIRVRMRRANGWGHAEIVGANLVDTAEVGGLVLTIRDINDRVQLEDELRRQAEHDALTGLANRSVFNAALARELADEKGGTTALLLLDIDDFKRINDGLGHPVGDDILVAVADRLRESLPPFAMAARLGGDEFAVVVPAVSSIGSVGGLAQQIGLAIGAPIMANSQAVAVSASIGIAVADSGQDAETLVRQADAAMYGAKVSGPGRVQRYTPSLAAQVETELTLRRGLDGARDRDELRVVYQTIINATDGQPCMLEALLRWDHPELGPISPGVFIPIADSSGLIDEIGMWVIETACSVGAPFAPDVATAVNVSVRQLRSTTFVGQVIRALKTAGLPAGSLVLEVSQDALREPQTKSRLDQLRRYGVAVALERFGSDYATLTGLGDLDVDIVKIDQHLLRDDCISPALIEAIIHQAGKVGIDVVVQGIETEGIREQMAQSGVTSLQGYAISMPVSQGEIPRQPVMPTVRS